MPFWPTRHRASQRAELFTRQLTEDVEAVLLLANSIQVTYLPPNGVAQQQILNPVPRLFHRDPSCVSRASVWPAFTAAMHGHHRVEPAPLNTCHLW